MSLAAAPAARLRRRLWDRVSLLLTIAALATLIYLVVRIVTALAAGDFALSSAPVGAGGLALAAFVYLSAHGFRILRLGLLIGGWRVGLRAIASFHLMTSAVRYAAPLNVGEVYRVLELSNLVGGLVRAVLIAWWERVFDIAVILTLLLLTFTLQPTEAHEALYGIAAVAGIFILGTVVMFFVAPDNFRRLSLLIIRRYDSPRSVPLLRALHVARAAIQEAPAMVANKLPSLITLTALIWACEVTCFAILFPSFADSFGAAVEHLLAFLSAITEGESLLGVLNGERGEALYYFAGTQAPLALIGLGAGVAYVTMRWKRGAP